MDRFRAIIAAVAGWHVVDTFTNELVKGLDGWPRVWLWAQNAIDYAARLNAAERGK